VVPVTAAFIAPAFPTYGTSLPTASCALSWSHLPTTFPTFLPHPATPAATTHTFLTKHTPTLSPHLCYLPPTAATPPARLPPTWHFTTYHHCSSWTVFCHLILLPPTRPPSFHAANQAARYRSNARRLPFPVTRHISQAGQQGGATYRKPGFKTGRDKGERRRRAERRSTKENYPSKTMPVWAARASPAWRQTRWYYNTPLLSRCTL